MKSEVARPDAKVNNVLMPVPLAYGGGSQLQQIKRYDDPDQEPIAEVDEEGMESGAIPNQVLNNLSDKAKLVNPSSGVVASGRQASQKLSDAGSIAVKLSEKLTPKQRLTPSKAPSDKIQIVGSGAQDEEEEKKGEPLSNEDN